MPQLPPPLTRNHSCPYPQYRGSKSHSGTPVRKPVAELVGLSCVLLYCCNDRKEYRGEQGRKEHFCCYYTHSRLPAARGSLEVFMLRCTYILPLFPQLPHLFTLPWIGVLSARQRPVLVQSARKTRAIRDLTPPSPITRYWVVDTRLTHGVDGLLTSH